MMLITFAMHLDFPLLKTAIQVFCPFSELDGRLLTDNLYTQTYTYIQTYVDFIHIPTHVPMAAFPHCYVLR